jgi:hypothetical protein
MCGAAWQSGRRFVSDTGSFTRPQWEDEMALGQNVPQAK